MASTDITVNIRAHIGSDVDECRMLFVPVTLRAKSDDDASPVLEGYAARFDDWTQIGGDSWGFMESIAPGAFAESLKTDDIRAFFNHDSNQVLGRTKAGTAEFTEDDKGLRAVIYPPDTAVGRDVAALIRRGDVTGMSFMFRTLGETWEEPRAKGDLPKRTLTKVQLFEAGPVTFPAYEATSISARDKAQAFFDMASRQVDPDVLARRKEADRLAFELAVAAIEL